LYLGFTGLRAEWSSWELWAIEDVVSIVNRAERAIKVQFHPQSRTPTLCQSNSWASWLWGALRGNEVREDLDQNWQYER
jgi:hypothetical protein